MRGAIAIVTFAGRDAVDAGDAASRGSWETSVFGQDGSAPALPLAWRRPTFGWTDSLDSATDDQLETRPAKCLRLPVPPPWDRSFGERIVAKASASKPKKHRVRNVGHLLGASESPGALPMRKTALASGPRVHRAPGVPHALSQGAGMQRTTAPPRRKQQGR